MAGSSAWGRSADAGKAARSGPLCALARRAERLILGLADFAAGEELFLDVPGPNAEAMAMAGDLGLDLRFETARMYRGPAPARPCTASSG